MTNVTQSNIRPSKTDIINLFDEFSIELTTNTVIKRTNLRSLFIENQLIYVTFLPGAEFASTLLACEKLINLGFQARPHIAARSLHSHEELERGLAKIQQLGITSVLLLAGAVKNTKGPFNSSLDILKDYYLPDFGVETISFAGHPEGNPAILPIEIEQFEKIKHDYINNHHLNGSFTTQFCFNAAPVIKWTEHLQEMNIHMPVSVGIPGVLSTKSLINHARACGVGASMNYMLRYSRSIKQLLSLNTPDTLIYDLALYRATHENNTLINKIHFFPFGGLDATLDWINHIRHGEFDFDKKGLRIHAQ